VVEINVAMHLNRIGPRLLKTVEAVVVLKDCATDQLGSRSVSACRRWFSDIPEEYTKFYKNTTITAKARIESSQNGSATENATQASASAASTSQLNGSSSSAEINESDQRLAAKAGAAEWCCLCFRCH
jgi:hypothetical protein